MFCPQCGHPNAPNAKFCIADGTPLSPVSAAPTAGSARAGAGTGAAAAAMFAGVVGSRSRVTLLIGGAVTLVVIFGMYQAFSAWQSSQQQAAYTRGVQAIGERNFEKAGEEFGRAGGYLDAKARVEEAQKRVGEALPHFDKANEAARQGLNWDAAHEYRQALDVHPKFRDAEKKLADLRQKIGRLVWYPQRGGNGSIWSAPADGGDRKEVSSGGIQALHFVAPFSRLLFTIGDTNRQVLYLSDPDGANRKEVLAADSIEIRRPNPPAQFKAAASRAIVLTTTKANQNTSVQTLSAIDLRTGDRKELLSSATVSVYALTDDTSKVLVSTPSDSGPTTPPSPAAKPGPAAKPAQANQQPERILQIVDATTGAQTEIARGRGLNAAMAPDGKSVYYSFVERDSRSEFVRGFLTHPGAGDRIDLGEAQGMSGRFTDDGRVLGITLAPRNSSQTTLQIVDAQTGGRVDAVQASGISSWLHTSDAKKLFVAAIEGEGPSQRGVVYQLDETGQNRVEIAAGKSDTPSVYFAWNPSPDLPRRVLVSYTDRNRSQSSAFILNGDGSGRRELGDGVYIFGAAVSPDGKSVAFVQTDSTRGQSGAARMMSVDLTAASEPVQIAAAARIEFVGWSPDSQRLAYRQLSIPQSGNQSAETSVLFVADPTGKVKPVRVLDAISGGAFWTEMVAKTPN